MSDLMSRPTQDPWIIRLLYIFCKSYYVDQIAGDLLEIYARSNGSSAGKRIRLFFWTLGFLRLRYLKTPVELLKLKGYNMYGNYFKISFRNLAKHKFFSFLNIAGLAVGLAGALLITVHLLNEISYDEHIPEKDQIYYLSNNGIGRYSPAPLPGKMISDLPEVIDGVRIWSFSDLIATKDQQNYKLARGLAVDSTFFKFFPNEFIQGNPETALNQPGSIILTTSTAQRIFGNDNPMGQTLAIEGEKGEVRAIVADGVDQTSVPYDYLVDMPRYPSVTNGNWTGNNFFTFIKTETDIDPLLVEFKITELIRTYAGPEFAKYGEDVDDYLSIRPRPFQLVSLTDIHLYHPGLSLGEGGSIQQVWILLVIGVLLLLIAVINYVNLITAKAGLRLKEIGMRKVYGSDRQQVIRQFFVESFVITGIAFVLALLLVVIALPFFSDQLQRNLTLSHVLSMEALVGMLLLLIVTAILAGIYPAFYLSGFKPVHALKGEFKGNRVNLRKALVVFQFAISIMLITTTTIVFQQVQMMRQFDAGWDRAATFCIQRMDIVADNYEVISNELKALPFVEQVSITNMMPSQNGISNYNYRTMGEEPRTFAPDNIFADANYLDVLGLELVNGRFFQEGRYADTLTVVINETFAKSLGWEQPIGRTLTRGEGYDFKIIGIVRDFYPTSVKRAIRPLVIRYADEVNEYLSVSEKLLVRMNQTSPGQVEAFAGIFEKHSDGYPFEGVFLDDSFQRLYENDERFGAMFTTFSGLALFIASLGLISLASYSMDRRMKEIAVRKVLGASGSQLLTLLVKEYLVLVVVSAFIAIPLVYYYAHGWLDDFANRISLSWWVFALPVMVVLGFTLVLVLSQTMKVTRYNPVHSLKQE